MSRETRVVIAAILMSAIGATASSSVAATKSSIACGGIYTVERGDTLYKIADRAYANGRVYKKIFDANRDLLPDMQSVEIGDQLLIPCLDGTGPTTYRMALAIRSGSEIAAGAGFVELNDPIELNGPFVSGASFGVVGPLEVTEPVNFSAPIKVAGPAENALPFDVIQPFVLAKVDLEKTMAVLEPVGITEHMRILTGSGFAPYADKYLPAGGMITDLIMRGVNNVEPERELSVSFINDWEAHLVTLLPGESFDVSFPWVKPDCSDLEGLNNMARSLCANYRFSNPFFEVAVGYYTRADNSLIDAENTARLRDKRICRTEGQFQFGPSQVSLAATNVETQKTAKECLTRLLEGKVDVVKLIKLGTDAELRQFSGIDQIVEIEGLAATLSLHAVVALSSPVGQANLAVINRGLDNLMASGEWFEVVVRHRSKLLAELN